MEESDALAAQSDPWTFGLLLELTSLQLNIIQIELTDITANTENANVHSWYLHKKFTFTNLNCSWKID
jgi:hypothetical protein